MASNAPLNPSGTEIASAIGYFPYTEWLCQHRKVRWQDIFLLHAGKRGFSVVLPFKEFRHENPFSEPLDRLAHLRD